MAAELNYMVRQSKYCYEHHDFDHSTPTAISVDYTGQFVLLAGRRHLSLQRLGLEPSRQATTRKSFSQASKYEVSAAEFAICPNRQEFCAIATRSHIDVVTWNSAEPRHLTSLLGHTRTVTDIDWHGKNPNLLVSCSIDTFSHIWDLREPRKPTLSLSAVCMSGATQVGFNRVSGNLLAAAHDGDLRIWDMRKGSCPIHYITAHLNRVHGINWSHRRETCLATASQDGTVKYFDINNPRHAEKIITTSSPVWRARYTPIGNGLVTIVVPHLGRGENSLLLWSNSKQTDPICSFVGHTDVILDFAWRPDRENQSEIELVTWSRDRTLRVWKIDEIMLQLCEPDLDVEPEHEPFSSETPTKYTPIHSSSSLQQISSAFPHSLDLPPATEAIDALMARSPSIAFRKDDSMHIARSLTDEPTCSLHHEFSLLNTNIPGIVEVDVLDAIKRNAVFKISAAGQIVVLQANFPTEYPSPAGSPEFSFLQGTTISTHLSLVLLKVLKTNALQRVKKSRTCLEQCLRALVANLKKSIGGSSEKSTLRLQSPRLEGALSGALHDACIPFPRTSAAKFNAIGMLVTFSQVLNTKRITLRNQNITPRTLSAINGSGLLGNVMGQPVLYAHRDSNASFYLNDRMNSKHSKNRSLQKTSSSSSPIVHIYDVARLLNLSKEMSYQLSLDKTNMLETCKNNKQICESHGRHDLVNLWRVAELIATPNIPNESKYESLFYNDPFKKFLLESLIMHYAHAGDIQTAAMLCCLFHKCAPLADLDGFIGGYAHKYSQLNKYAAPFFKHHTVVPMNNPALHAKFAAAAATMHTVKQMRSNSWSETLEWDSNINTDNAYYCSLLRKSQMPLFDNFKKTYAEVLFGWQLLDKRALILKHIMFPTCMLPQDVEFLTDCSGCNKPIRTNGCASCRRPVLYCILCCLPVKGAANTCLSCGHGGHSLHMMQWFKTHNTCASGCGCECIKQTDLMLKYIN